jgi:hypothetical protein
VTRGESFCAGGCDLARPKKTFFCGADEFTRNANDSFEIRFCKFGCHLVTIAASHQSPRARAMSLPCATQTCCAVAVRGKHGDGAGVGVRANTFFANARVARRKRAVSWTSFSRTIAGRGARCLGYHGEHDKHGAECVTSDDHAYGLFGNSGGDDGGGGGDDNGDGNGNGDDCGDGPEKETKILLFTLAPAVARGWFNDDDDECTGQLTTHAEARDHTSSSAVSSYDESKDESTRTDKETNGTRMATSDEKSQNSVSIVIPALNESAQIASLLSRLRSLDPAPLEIIVAIGDSTDATEQIIKANFPDVKIVKGNRGRSSQMNAGAKVAKGKQVRPWGFPKSRHTVEARLRPTFTHPRSPKD